MLASFAIEAKSPRRSTMPKRPLSWRNEFGSLAAYFWSFEPTPEDRPDKFDHADLRADRNHGRVQESSAKILRKRGWSFVGPTTVYAFMQAMGLVNDHIEGCFCREEVEAARNQLTRPTYEIMTKYTKDYLRVSQTVFGQGAISPGGLARADRKFSAASISREKVSLISVVA